MSLRPANVSEALANGGIPPGATADALQWLEVKHRDLASRGRKLTAHDCWRLRWAYTCHDLLITLLGEPGQASAAPRHRVWPPRS